jgi:hypothetical protein
LSRGIVILNKCVDVFARGVFDGFVHVFAIHQSLVYCQLRIRALLLAVTFTSFFCFDILSLLGRMLSDVPAYQLAQHRRRIQLGVGSFDGVNELLP